MDLAEKVTRLRAQGVTIPAPQTLEIDESVPLEQILGPETVLHAGTRLRGGETIISPGCEIGREAPVTLENCALAERVQLKGGYFAGSVFLEQASMGLGAHVRPGSLLEEEASGAHTVGLKQSILFPFVTLGSLINFCDVLMAGGTSRRDHSEVGSSFIHFNYTPHGRHGDKATPSLIGDVPHGVMLRSTRIFLGGQAGLVGPVQIDYGTVLAAGYVYRHDHGPDALVVGEALKPGTRTFCASRYRRVKARVVKNLTFLGNLAALWQWYESVRLPLASHQAPLQKVYRRAQRVIERHFADRVKQLDRLASYMEDSIAQLQRAPWGSAVAEIEQQRALAANWPRMRERLGACRATGEPTGAQWHELADALQRSKRSSYLETIAGLSDSAAGAGTRWLSSIVARFASLADALPD